MTAPLNRRGVIALFGAGTAAAAAGGARPAAMALGRLRRGIAGERLGGVARALTPAVEAAVPLACEIPGSMAALVAKLGTDPAAALAQRAAEVRAIAALALTYPPEVAAPRSFGAAMRRRMYAELLARESARLMPPAEPPPTPPASPGPGA